MKGEGGSVEIEMKDESRPQGAGLRWEPVETEPEGR